MPLNGGLSPPRGRKETLLNRRAAETLSLAALFLSVSCAGYVDWSDKRALRRQCRIPAGAVLVEFKGYPAMVGFGQREGLSIWGTFRLAEEDRARFEKEAASQGWEPLPVPDDVLAKIWYKEPALRLDLRKGLYRCRTAGDDVLHAKRTRPVAEVEKPNDFILSVYDPESRQIYAAVKSGY